MLYNRGAEASGRYQVGTFRRALGSNPNNFFETRVAQYIERTLLSTQLRGDHAFGQKGPRLKWTGTLTNTNQDEPDLRFFADDFTIVGADTSFRFNTAYPQPTRYFRDLSETGATGAADLDVPVHLPRRPGHAEGRWPRREEGPNVPRAHLQVSPEQRDLRRQPHRLLRRRQRRLAG